MPPVLLLALVLLGMACASRPEAAPLHPPGVLTVAAEKSGHLFRYSVVTKCRTYNGAQKYCRELLRGQLASVHSAALNQQLQELARTYTRRRSLWIGAVTHPKGPHSGSKWEDGSPWNFSNWAPTHPRKLFPTCTTLSTRDGLWRSRACFKRRPFICQY